MKIESPPLVLARRLLRLERRGAYVSALDSLSASWRDPYFLPETRDLSPREAAEILLRFGALIGFVGPLEMLDGAQKRSQNVLFAARERFLELGLREKMAECANYSALANARTGEYPEADLWLDEALSVDLPDSSPIRLHSQLIRALVYMLSRRFQESVDYTFEIEDKFRLYADAYLNGSLYANLAVALKDLGRPTESLRYFNIARKFHARSGHRILRAILENNVALLHLNEGRFSQAYECADVAIASYKKLGDKAREASSLETKAQIYLSEGRIAESLKTIDRSISMLRKCEDQAFLPDSIATRAKCLLAMDCPADAMLVVSEAIQMTNVRSGEESALKLVTDFQNAYDRYRMAKSEVIDSELAIELPPSLASYSNYRGVWINNSHLARYGIHTGSLAVVVAQLPLPGDAAAVRERSNGEVTCGIFDQDFGIICIETESGEPMLFDEAAVEVLGKIVGVCRNEKNAKGRMVAEPIKTATEAD